MALFESRTELSCTPERLFEFITRPANLKAIAPAEVDLSFVEAPEVLSLGSKLVFKVQGFGIVQQLEHEVIEFDPPRGFREQMVKGPLPHWQHAYILEPDDSGGVALLNRIEFEPPSGILGMILTAQRMLDHLQKEYGHRSAALKQALST
jgi:ligand-binding SRPBCC domain-containing protein